MVRGLPGGRLCVPPARRPRGGPRGFGPRGVDRLAAFLAALVRAALFILAALLFILAALICAALFMLFILAALVLAALVVLAVLTRGLLL